MIELIKFMNQHFLQGVILDLILTRILTIFCILFKLNLSTINLLSIFNDKPVISSIPTYFENKESPII